MKVELPMGKRGTFPTAAGRYVVWQDHGPTLVLHWSPESKQRDWRHGSFKIEAAAWMGPLPTEFPK